jgi:hypothetical protein
MPFKYKIFQEQKTIVVQAVGKIEFPSILQAMKNVVAEEDFHSRYRVLVDLRKMDFKPSVHDLFNIRDSLAMLKNQYAGEIVLIVTKEMVPVATLFCAMAKVYHIKISYTTHLKGLEELEQNL